eukprot:TRINITY_DN2168_c0_g1_i1.p1 TRINITY_DN2168_c0_g1~~TRINITY_DN2168_c0_g1_i1.p1  ORF type:complete len:345 (+),score=80.13 TRINITY_DN2168_c0_g1_i1:35-1069(+)
MISRTVLQRSSVSVRIVRSLVAVRFYSTAPKIPITLIQELRNKTGAGITDCKKALEASNADIKAAAEWLKNKGKATATKLSSRVAAEGLVGLSCSHNKGVLVEMNSETDFVSRGKSFKELTYQIAASTSSSTLLPSGSISEINVDEISKLNVKAEPEEVGGPISHIPVSDAILQAITKTKENMKLRRAFGITVPQGVVGGATHGGEGDSRVGRVGVLVALSTDKPISKNIEEQLTGLASRIGTHIVAMRPVYVSKSDLLSDKKSNIEARAESSNKKIDEMVEDLVLLNQKCFPEETNTIAEILEQTGDDLDCSIKVDSFVRVTVGEGIEKKEDDFAKQVLDMIK